MPDDVTALVTEHLDDPESGWSMGVPGAIAEFVRTADEPVSRSTCACAPRARCALRVPRRVRATPARPRLTGGGAARRCRAAWEVAFRVLAHTRAGPQILSTWRGRTTADELLDHEGDRNAG